MLWMSANVYLFSRFMTSMARTEELLLSSFFFHKFLYIHFILIYSLKVETYASESEDGVMIFCAAPTIQQKILIFK
jgi:hypothetical protein